MENTVRDCGEDVGGEAVGQRLPPGNPRWWGNAKFGRRFAARTSWESLSGASESPNLGCAERKVQFLIVAQLLDNSGVIRKGDNSVNTVPRIRPGLVRRSNMARIYCTGTCIFMPIGQEAERPRDRKAMARQT